jgi:hypothetical protein
MSGPAARRAAGADRLARRRLVRVAEPREGLGHDRAIVGRLLFVRFRQAANADHLSLGDDFDNVLNGDDELAAPKATRSHEQSFRLPACVEHHLIDDADVRGGRVDEETMAMGKPVLRIHTRGVERQVDSLFFAQAPH